MPPVEAVFLAGTSIFLDECETAGEVMARIAITKQRLATDIAIIDPISGERLKPDKDIELAKVNVVILDEEDDVDVDTLALNLRLHAEQDDVATCSTMLGKLLEWDQRQGLWEGVSQLRRVLQQKRRCWRVATRVLLRVGIPGGRSLFGCAGDRFVDGIETILAHHLPTDDSIAEWRDITLSRVIFFRDDPTRIVKILLAAGANANVENSIALIEASVSRRTEIVDALLAAGADSNATDGDGQPVLVAACRQPGCLTVVKALLAAGSDVNGSVINDRTALIEASARENIEVVKVLVAAGADCNAKDGCGRTALIEASARGFVEVVKVLIAAGADCNAKDEYGRTALIEASAKGFGEIGELLVSTAREDGLTASPVATENVRTILDRELEKDDQFQKKKQRTQ